MRIETIVNITVPVTAGLIADKFALAQQITETIRQGVRTGVVSVDRQNR